MHRCLIVAALMPFVVGCGGSNIAPVSGRVTLDDRPLANATVLFQPVSNEKFPGPSSAGKTDEHGEYTLQLATSEVRGARVGKHKVVITAYEGNGAIPSSSGGGIVPKGLVPRWYNVESELTFDVPPEGSTSANFDLKTSASDGK